MSKEYRKQLADGYKENPKKNPEYKIYYDEFYKPEVVEEVKVAKPKNKGKRK